MTRGFVRLGIIFVFVISFSLNSLAQEEEDQNMTGGPRRQMATIIFAGLAGAILGLSTLSFYGRPQDKLSNIAVGFAIGVISGTIYTTFKAATQPREYYGYNFLPEYEKLEEIRIKGGAESKPLFLRWNQTF